MPQPLRAVLFDLDGTLFDRATAVERLALDQAHALADVLGGIDPTTFANRVVALDDRGYRKKPEVYAQLAVEFALAPHPRLDPERLTDDFFRRYADHPIAFDGSVALLEAVRARGLKTALVTNGRVAVQQHKVDTLGLGALFDAVLISEAEGLRKPDPAIFARALDRIGVAATEAVYVGDHPDNDVRAARAAGLWALWKTDTHWPAPPDAHGHVTSWADLLHWIDTR